MIFLEEEYRSCDNTDRQDGGKFGQGNDCAGDGTAAATAPRASSAWKSKQGPVFYEGERLATKPPAKSLAGAKKVEIVDGELVAGSLKEVGVTLDQAVKTCGAVTPDSEIIVSHGGLREMVTFMSSRNPPRVVEDRVTVISKMDVADIQGAATVAASLARDDGDLVMTYTMLTVSDEAQQKAQFSVARQMMKGTVESVTQAEKLGVDRVEMLAAGSVSNKSFKGYRIWPRLGFDGVIPRKSITPTYTLKTGLFNSYGSKIPDGILSPKAKAEKKSGALTIQSLYETSEGQKWWEENGSEMEMTLSIGDNKSPGWERFKAVREKFSSRSIDVSSAFFDIESASLLDEAWSEIRAFCPNGEGGGISNSCGSSEKMSPDTGGGSGGVATASQKPATDDWKKQREPVDLTGEEMKESSPVTGGEKLSSFHLNDPVMAQEAMSNIGIKTMDDLVTLGGGVIRDSSVRIASGSDDLIHITMVTPVVAGQGEDSGYVHTSVDIYSRIDDDGNQTSHLGFEGLMPARPLMTGEISQPNVARVASIMTQRVVESMAKADELGFHSAEMQAVGSADNRLKGYRLWPQFGFDGDIPSRIHASIPSSLIEKIWRKNRPDLFATRVPASAMTQSLRSKPLTIQQLISVPEGDRWWDENGDDISLTFDFKDKESLGYKRFQSKVQRLGRYRDRNKSRSLEEWIEDLIESRTCDDSDRQA